MVECRCCCVVVGWLQPLLSRVDKNRTIVAVPVMDIIDDSTFEYKSFDTQSINIGGFDWSLQFTWIGVSDRERRRRPSDIAPVRYTDIVNNSLYSPSAVVAGRLQNIQGNKNKPATEIARQTGRQKEVDYKQNCVHFK